MFVHTHSAIRCASAPVPSRQRPVKLKCALSKRPKIKPKIPKIRVENVDSSQLQNQASDVVDVTKMFVGDQRQGQQHEFRTTFGTDIVKLIQLSREFQRNCSEHSSAPRSAGAIVANATATNRSCITSRVQPAQNLTSARQQQQQHKAPTFDQQTSLLCGEVPSIFDDQQMKEYGSKLVDAFFQNSMFSDDNRAATTTKMVVIKKLATSVPRQQMQQSIRARSSSRAAAKSQTMTPQRTVLINDKSKEILEGLNKRGQFIRAHSCVESMAGSTPRDSGSARGKQKFLSRYYDFQRTHPNIKLVRSDSVIPRRVVAPFNTTDQRAAANGGLAKEQLRQTPRGAAPAKTWHQLLSCSVTESRATNESFQDRAVPLGRDNATPMDGVSDGTVRKNPLAMNNIQIMPPISIKPKISCAIQKIYDIEIKPGFGKAKSNSVNNKIFNITYKNEEVSAPESKPVTNDPNSEAVHHPAAPETAMFPEPSVGSDAGRATPKPIDMREQHFSDSSIFADAISIHTCSSSSNKSIDRFAVSSTGLGKAVPSSISNEDSRSLLLRKPTVELDYSRPSVVQDFIREVLQSEGYISPRMQEQLPSSGAVENLTPPKSVLQQTIDEIRNDKTSLDVSALHSGRKSANQIEPKTAGASITPKTPATDREVQCNLMVPPLNTTISQPISGRSDGLATANAHPERAFHLEFDETSGTSSSATSILPCHGTLGSSGRRRHRSPAAAPSPKLYSSLKNSPKFARTINSIRNSARSLNSMLDHRTAAYRNVSDREIQLAAERFLYSVKKERQFGRQIEPRRGISSGSSDSEDDRARGNCRIVDDQVIQSNFNVLTDEGMMSATSIDENSSSAAPKAQQRKTVDLLSGRISDSSDLEYSMTSIEHQIARLRLLGIKGSVTSLSQGPTHRMPYGQLDLSDGEILSEGEIRTASIESDIF